MTTEKVTTSDEVGKCTEKFTTIEEVIRGTDEVHKRTDNITTNEDVDKGNKIIGRYERVSGHNM